MIVQVISAMTSALVHGGNDVANCIGPFVVIYLVFKVKYRFYCCQCFGSGSGSVSFGRIRIRVAPKTYQTHEKQTKIVLKNTIYTKKKKILLKVYFLLHFGFYSKYSLYEKKHCKTLIKEIKIHRVKIT